jgi:hypothetical protein
MTRLLTLAFVFCASILFAQTPGKKHFVIHRIDNTVDITPYQQAASNYGQLDQFRFLDKRRTIYFTDNRATIELYSAQELYEMFGKEISPLTITTGKYPEVAFEVTPNKSLKPQLTSISK